MPHRRRSIVIVLAATIGVVCAGTAISAHATSAGEVASSLSATSARASVSEDGYLDRFAGMQTALSELDVQWMSEFSTSGVLTVSLSEAATASERAVVAQILEDVYPELRAQVDLVTFAPSAGDHLF